MWLGKCWGKGITNDETKFDEVNFETKFDEINDETTFGESQLSASPMKSF